MGTEKLALTRAEPTDHIRVACEQRCWLGVVRPECSDVLANSFPLQLPRYRGSKYTTLYTQCALGLYVKLDDQHVPPLANDTHLLWNPNGASDVIPVSNRPGAIPFTRILSRMNSCHGVVCQNLGQMCDG